MAVGKKSAIEIINEEENITKKRTKDPGVRVKGNRIYDSENGKTCHQCRQKTMDFSASCKNVKKDKLCTLKICHKCLFNRYGEKAEEVDKLEDWHCPRCREICNCSFCMKRKGYQPTGMLTPTAKATGFNSVQELLHNKGSEVLEPINLINDTAATPKNSPLSKKGLTGSKRKHDKENQCVEPKDVESNDKLAKKENKKALKKAKSVESDGSEVFTVNQSKIPKSKKTKNHVESDANQNKGSEVLEPRNLINDTAASPKNSPLSKKGSIGSKRKQDKKNQCVEPKDVESNDKLAKKENKRASKTEKSVESCESEVFIADQSKVPESKKIKNHVENDADQNKGSEVLEPRNLINDAAASPKNSPLSKKGLTGSKRKHDKENQCVEPKDVESNAKLANKENTKELTKAKSVENEESEVFITNQSKTPKSKKTKNHVENDANQNKEYTARIKAFKSKICMKPHFEIKKEDIVLPSGKPLAQIAELDLPAQDVGAALQFLEFCNAFTEILDIKRGEPECILRDITKGHVKRHRGCRGHSALVRFIIRLLSIIFPDMKKEGNVWLQILKTCITESKCELKELRMDFINEGPYGFEKLEPSEKLLILVFLCDEVLVTEELRKSIEEAEAKFDEKRKEHKEKVADAKKKEKLIKQKAKDELAKFMLSARGGASLSISEFDELLSQIRDEADKVHAEVTASLELVPKKSQRSDAVRTDPVMLDSNGKIFWKLNSYNHSSNMILQDMGCWDSVTWQDKWFIFDEHEEKVAEKYISSSRNATLVIHSSGDVKSASKPECPDSPEFEHEEMENLAVAVTPESGIAFERLA